MTAAHCIRTSSPKLTGVRLGEWDLETESYCDDLVGCMNPAMDVEIESVIMHEGFVRRSGLDEGHNDIALIKLGEAANYTQYIKPICLPELPVLRKGSLQNKKLKISGWDRTDDNQRLTRYKTQADILGLNFEECQQSLAKYRSLISGQFCGMGQNGEDDACVGYSGGPVMRFYQNQYYLTGIISYGPPECGRLDIPDVYTRVGNYMDWINEKIDT